MIESMQIAELRVPYRSSAIAASIGYLFVLTLVSVAVSNLAFIRHIPVLTTLASIVWLLLVSWFVLNRVRDEGGVRQFVINRMGLYSRNQFVRAQTTDNGVSISIGYVLLARSLNYLTIDATSISSVDWNGGQATSMAGRDMKDWQVALWYYHPQGKKRQLFPGEREEEICLIGQSGPREQVAVFGKQLVEFLTHIGVDFTPGRDDCEFNTSSRCVACEQSGESETPISRILDS